MRIEKHIDEIGRSKEEEAVREREKTRDGGLKVSDRGWAS